MAQKESNVNPDQPTLLCDCVGGGSGCPYDPFRPAWQPRAYQIGLSPSCSAFSGPRGTTSAVDVGSLNVHESVRRPKPDQSSVSLPLEIDVQSAGRTALLDMPTSPPPAARADRLVKLSLWEVIAEEAASRTRGTIDQHTLGSVVVVKRRHPIRTVTSIPPATNRAVEYVNQLGRGLPFAIPLLVQKKGVLEYPAEELRKQTVPSYSRCMFLRTTSTSIS